MEKYVEISASTGKIVKFNNVMYRLTSNIEYIYGGDMSDVDIHPAEPHATAVNIYTHEPVELYWWFCDVDDIPPSADRWPEPHGLLAGD